MANRRSPSLMPRKQPKSRPIPPKTRIRIKRLWPYARKKGHNVGDVWRVGYYARDDGLDVIWLVDRNGLYDWTIDHEFLEKNFDIIKVSYETALYGRGKPRLRALNIQS